MTEYEQNIEIMKDLRNRLDKVLETKQINIQPKDTSKGHFYVSLIKSVLRIGAGIALAMSSFTEAGVLFIIAEILGIIEEIV